MGLVWSVEIVWSGVVWSGVSMECGDSMEWGYYGVWDSMECGC